MDGIVFKVHSVIAPSASRAIDASMRLRDAIFLALFMLSGTLRAAADLPVPPDDPDIPDDGTRVSVLGYHDFSETLPETEMRINTTKFRTQLETIIQRGITIISLQDFIAWKRGDLELPEKCVLLTFDDGWLSVYTDAFPILKELGLPFTLYLYKNYVDGGGKALTSGMIREMLANGATLGSHSVSHPRPSMVRAQRDKGPDAFEKYLQIELGKSKVFLEKHFGVPVTTYAYPGGFFTEEMLEFAPTVGYTHLFTVQPRKVRRGSPDMALPRYMILGTHDRIFEYAITFQDPSGALALAEGHVAAPVEITPYRVLPESGAIVNSRTPEISADLADVDDLDPATLTMKIDGFGKVPATFDADSRRISWKPNRRLRHPVCRVEVSWKDAAGKPPEKPLTWSFQLDREAAYLGESE